MTDHLQMLAALCGPDGPAGLGGLLAALFVAGLVGSVVHCAAMCGPFVLSQVSGALQRIPAARLCERHRVTSGLLLPYHAGRLLTYAALGAIGAGSGAWASTSPLGHVVPGVLLALAALLFLGQAVRRLAPSWRLFASGGRPTPWGHLVASAARGIDRTRAGGGFLLGLVLGLLPCGFLYAAIAVASSTLSPWRGALAMLAFGIGTMPSLMLVGMSGLISARRWSRAMAVAGPPLLLLNATVLMVLAYLRIFA